MQLNDVSLLICNEKTFPISKSKSQSSSEQEHMEVTVVDLLDHPHYLHLICEWIFSNPKCILPGQMFFYDFSIILKFHASKCRKMNKNLQHPKIITMEKNLSGLV